MRSLAHTRTSGDQAFVSRRQTVDGIGKIVGGMARETRERIMDEALRHVGSCGEHEVSRIVAKNLRVSERVVDAVVLASYLEVRTRLAALEVGLRGAVQASSEAGRAVWAELRGVA